MSVVLNRVRRRFYLDSVALMRLSVQLGKLDGIESASMMMATPSNREILADAGLLADEGSNAQSDDLIIAVLAANDTAAAFAQREAEQLLDAQRTKRHDDAASSRSAARNIGEAFEILPQANIALISVPGTFATREAVKALSLNLNVMMFSDNVSVDDEITLKREAQQKDLLVMGPDCGTAIIGGVPLGFANQVRRGDIGLIGASGTGLQEVSCLIDRSGYGISHAIGTGGRDLSATVGGVTTCAAIDLLLDDVETHSLVIVSKPPSVPVANTVLTKLTKADKPATVCFVGGGEFDVALPAHVRLTRGLAETAEAVTGVGFEELPASSPGSAHDGDIIGLFSGGTLCAEAQMLIRDAQLRLRSNTPLPGVDVDQDAVSGHRIIDLGADEFTLGQPHPMLEPSVRTPHLQSYLQDSRVAVILLDVVIGFGADPDPAKAVADVVAQYRPRSRGPVVVASVCGVDADPQSRQRQVAELQAAGVVVAPSNAAATRFALSLIKAVQPVPA